MATFSKQVIIVLISLISGIITYNFSTVLTGLADESITISILPQTFLPSNPPASPLSTSTYSSASYSPSSVCVLSNTTIIWINNDTMPHTVTFANLSYSSGNISQGNAFTHIFNKLGAYPYFDSNDKNVKGLVKVLNSKEECDIFLKKSIGQ
jgi:hypothetical protein